MFCVLQNLDRENEHLQSYDHYFGFSQLKVFLSLDIFRREIHARNTFTANLVFCLPFLLQPLHLCLDLGKKSKESEEEGT